MKELALAHIINGVGLQLALGHPTETFVEPRTWAAPPPKQT